MLNSIFYAIKQSFLQVYRNRSMSIASLFSITAMLLILGLFFVAAVNIDLAIEAAKNDYETVQIFLEDETTLEQTNEMMNTFEKMPEVVETSYMSKEEAMDQLRLDWGNDGEMLNSLSSNPLPNAIVVQVGELQDADALVEHARNISGVESVMYYKDTVEKLVKVTDSMQMGALIVMIFLVIVSVVVVSNTIKLTVLAREKEIEIMKYVGATNWFIRGPFLIEGILIGLLSALVSSGLIALIYDKIVELAGENVLLILRMQMVSVEFLTFNLIWIFIALGVSIGASGSIISMRRFLDT